MNELESKALLPAGLRDHLPPEAADEAALIERLMAEIAGRGYARVKAPLVEFEEGLLSGPGAAMGSETFRLMDPVSQRMMGLRADITPQIARIAATRLRREPRPLRLSYAGDVLRVKGNQLRPERQMTQVGAELIGSESLRADAEMVVLGASALTAVGIQNLSVDLTLPTLVPAVCDELGIDPAHRRRLRQALDHKDVAAVAAIGGPGAFLFEALISAAGRVETALDVLAQIKLPSAAAQERDRLTALVGLVREAMPDLALTVDPVEHRGFEYHSGICFTIFALGERGELGGGGRYRTGESTASGPIASEPATGLTLYVDTIMNRIAAGSPARRVFMPVEAASAEAAALRATGWTTVAGLDKADDPVAEARRQGCTHVAIGGAVRPVNQ